MLPKTKVSTIYKWTERNLRAAT